MGEWTTYSLIQLTETIIDNRGKTCPTSESGIPLIATNCLKQGQKYPVLEKVRYVNEETHKSWFRGHPEPGDILFVTKGSPGRVAVTPDPVDFCVAQDMVALRANRAVIDQSYLYYRLRNQDVQHNIEGLHVGTMIPHFKKGDFDKLPIRIHRNLRDQRAIAEVLGALDDKIAANDTVAGRSLELARTIYTHQVQHAERVTASQVLEPFLGGTPSRSDSSLWDGTTPWTSAKDITGAPFGVIVGTEQGISDKAATTKRLSPMPVGSVVLTARGTVGKVAQLAVPASINQSCYGFVPGPIPASCLRFVVESLSQEVKALVHGSVFDTITMQTFDHVDLPDWDEQDWQKLESRLQPLVTSVTARIRENEALATTRDQLLPLLMSGKITVKDAEDRVADAL